MSLVAQLTLFVPLVALLVVFWGDLGEWFWYSFSVEALRSVVAKT